MWSPPDIPLTALTGTSGGCRSAVIGGAFIVERDGHADRHLDAGSPCSATTRGSRFACASESTNPLVRQAWEKLRATAEPTRQHGARRRLRATHSMVTTVVRHERHCATRQRRTGLDDGRSAALRDHMGNVSAPSCKTSPLVWPLSGLAIASGSGSCTASPATCGGCRRPTPAGPRAPPERLSGGA